MKHIGFEYRPSAVVEFTREEMEILRECSARHYDHTCKAAGEPGGFLWGLKNRITFGDGEKAEERWTSDYFDLSCKILEQSSLVYSFGTLENPERGNKAAELFMRLHHCVVALNDEWVRLNKPQNGDVVKKSREKLIAALDQLSKVVESSLSHVSHGGPSRAQAQEAVDNARAALADAKKDSVDIWERELVGLTPGGSEFVGDPMRCSAYVRESIESKVNIIKRQVQKLKEREGTV